MGILCAEEYDSTFAAEMAEQEWADANVDRRVTCRWCKLTAVSPCNNLDLAGWSIAMLLCPTCYSVYTAVGRAASEAAQTPYGWYIEFEKLFGRTQ